jgi:hypothetical protein
MNRAQKLRSLRKDMLLLQAKQYRMALQHDLSHLNASGSDDKDYSAWLETAGSVLGAVLPARWGRWLNVGLSAWRIGKRIFAKHASTPTV